MIEIKDKIKCCGCTACANVCPKSAIIMLPDEEGFYYPVTNMELCVDCGVCNKVCPILNREKVKEHAQGYIIRHKDMDIVEQSTSGGAFTAFASYLLSQGAVVYGAGYDENMRVICKMAQSEEQLAEMRGSKFVQSQLGNTYKKIEIQLNSGLKVLFTGTPCQVSGLLNYLGGKPSNLICMDFVCRGVPSPKLWENYVKMMEKKYGSKMIGARFKHKTYGYHTTTMKVDFESGKTWYGSGRVDPMMKAFVNELASRPSCSACVFKGVGRLSDITMFDCYEFGEITGENDDDKGYTSLLIHTETGYKLLKEIADRLVIYHVDIDSLVTNNGIMVCNSAKPHKKRDEFYRLSTSMPIDMAMQKILPITVKDNVIEKAKGILYKTGLINVARKAKKKKVIEISDIH